MKQTKFYRKGKVIRSASGDQVFESITLARQESFKIQKANGGLGCGVLRVVEKLPPVERIQDKN